MGDYRVDAQLTFANVLYSRLQPLLSPATGTPAFEVATDGEAAVKGPIFKTDQLGGSFQLSRLSVTAMPQAGGGKPITISNQGPIAATLDRGVVRIWNCAASFICIASAGQDRTSAADRDRDPAE